MLVPYSREGLRGNQHGPSLLSISSITKTMRREISTNYLGIKVLLNRAWAAGPVVIRDKAIDGICGALRAILDVRPLGSRISGYAIDSRSFAVESNHLRSTDREVWKSLGKPARCS